MIKNACTSAVAESKNAYQQKPATIAILGCGVIGKSWLTAFVSKGHRVRVWDPDPKLEQAIKPLLDEFVDCHVQLCETPEEAVCAAEFIQESGPESLDAKQALYRQIAPAMAADCLLASSTSSLQPSALQQDIAFAERLVVGHPFNPPHILPLVEVVGGAQTSAQSIACAISFYQSIDKQVIHLRSERPGHLANRIQAAVWREAVDAVASGQCSAAEVDLAVTSALGPRWAVQGPFKTFQLGGGPGGLAHFLTHLGEAFEALWDDAQRPELSDDLQRQLVAEAAQLTSGESYAEAIAQRDKHLQSVINTVANWPKEGT